MDKFIPQTIINFLILCNLDGRKQKNYAVLPYDNYFKNDFNIAIINIKIKANQLYSRYLHSDIDNKEQNLILKLLFTIDNRKLTILIASDTIFSIHIFYTKNCLISINNRKKSFYFFAIFSALFFFEIVDI